MPTSHVPRKIHDKTFAKLVEQPAFVKELVKRYVPQKFYDTMEWETLTLEQLDTRRISRDLQRETQADVLYSIKMADQRGLLFCHIEHQSTADPLMALRLINYQTGLLLGYATRHGLEKVPMMFSLLHYHGRQSPYPYSMDWVDCFQTEEARAHACKPILIDWTQESDESILKNCPETAGAQLAFKYMFAKDFTPHQAQVLQALKQAPLPIRHIALEYITY